MKEIWTGPQACEGNVVICWGKGVVTHFPYVPRKALVCVSLYQFVWDLRLRIETGFARDFPITERKNNVRI